MKVLPKEINNNYEGRKIALYLFYLFTIMTLVRSLIHIFAPDGGAQTIATIPLDTFTDEGASAVILIFSLWGLSQLIMGIFYVIVSWRYRSLIPLMYLFIFIEYLMRFILGTLKPIETNGTAPGAIINFIFPPLVIILFLLSLDLRKAKKLNDVSR
ncbi:hypothetical protein LCM02_02370 [Lutimonas saemankumensis]|uniref:hypothetical protein n=1 Tax=Lutimonas saemankumensis TaxID=483016 RepID=UPI001CD737AC|nr:hypothetical protein [Lutimonas saemankumensis]MCA0931279.1 hypothetical protein [Lutimonas saemankumensis]